MPFTRRTYIAFDLEIYKIIDTDFSQWRRHRPLGITCAATSTRDGQVRVWCGIGGNGLAGFQPAGSLPTGSQPADCMLKQEAVGLVEYLEDEVRQGAMILTWNGLSFDFNVLAEESGLHDRCRALAMDHVDMMFHIFCEKGFPLGLDKAAKGMGLPGKPAGMSGALAPKLWHEGQRQQVLDYVRQDVETTLAIAQPVEKYKQLKWTSNSGKPQVLSLPDGWLTVREALQLTEPDTSWMSHPLSRQEFMDW